MKKISFATLLFTLAFGLSSCGGFFKAFKESAFVEPDNTPSLNDADGLRSVWRYAKDGKGYDLYFYRQPKVDYYHNGSLSRYELIYSYTPPTVTITDPKGRIKSITGIIEGDKLTFDDERIFIKDAR